jgi:hypothetical protein
MPLWRLLMRVRPLLALLLVAAVTGCSTTYSPPPRQSRPATTRCLAHPGEADARPLFFLFCVESP